MSRCRAISTRFYRRWSSRWISTHGVSTPQICALNTRRYDHPGEAIYAPLLLKQLSDRKPADSVVTTDVGQHQMWSAQHMTYTRPENFITSSGLGTMGFGLPAAVGAQVARPNDTVICISGDGSFMMNVRGARHREA